MLDLRQEYYVVTLAAWRIVATADTREEAREIQAGDPRPCVVMHRDEYRRREARTPS